MKRARRLAGSAFLFLFLILLPPGGASAQSQADIDAVLRLLDQYAELEEAMDMPSQARLISDDRVWIAQGLGRRTDQSQNMRIQEAQMALLKESMPGIRWFVEDRDRLVRFHGNGSVAIASFFRYSTYLIPPGTPPEVSEGLDQVPASAVTVVMEKVGGEWKIVHTHFSNLGPPVGSQ